MLWWWHQFQWIFRGCKKGVGWVVGAVVGIVIYNEVDSNVGNEVGERVKLEVGGKCVSINMWNIKSMWRAWNCRLSGLVNPGLVTSSLWFLMLCFLIKYNIWNLWLEVVGSFKSYFIYDSVG